MGCIEVVMTMSGDLCSSSAPCQGKVWMMGRTVLVLASAALAILFISTINGSSPTTAQTTPVKPNFVFILTDDMRQDDLKYMPKTRALLGDQGMQFANAFVSNPCAAPAGPPSCAASTPITRGFGLTRQVPMGRGRATRTMATSKTTLPRVPRCRLPDWALRQVL